VKDALSRLFHLFLGEKTAPGPALRESLVDEADETNISSTVLPELPINSVSNVLCESRDSPVEPDRFKRVIVVSRSDTPLPPAPELSVTQRETLVHTVTGRTPERSLPVSRRYRRSWSLSAPAFLKVDRRSSSRPCHVPIISHDPLPRTVDLLEIDSLILLTIQRMESSFNKMLSAIEGQRVSPRLEGCRSQSRFLRTTSSSPEKERDRAPPSRGVMRSPSPRVSLERDSSVEEIPGV